LERIDLDRIGFLRKSSALWVASERRRRDKRIGKTYRVSATKWRFPLWAKR
jgi:hypothetical protein